MEKHNKAAKAAKNAIQNIVSAQKILAGNVFVPLITPEYTDEVVKQSNDITENLVKAAHIKRL